MAAGVAVLAAVAAFALPAAGVAASPGVGSRDATVAASNGGAAVGSAVSVVANAFGVSGHKAACLAADSRGANGPVIPASLLKQVQSNPKQTFNLILQGKLGSVAALTRALTRWARAHRQALQVDSGLNVTISGKDLLKVAQKWPGLLSAITLNQTMKTADYQDATMWPSSADVAPLWNAFVRTSVTSPDLFRRLRRSRSSTAASTRRTRPTSGRGSSRAPTSARSARTPTGNDLEGHGTMVAGVAAAQAPTIRALPRTHRS